jgi:hypothetical protein
MEFMIGTSKAAKLFKIKPGGETAFRQENKTWIFAIFKSAAGRRGGGGSFTRPLVYCVNPCETRY